MSRIERILNYVGAFSAATVSGLYLSFVSGALTQYVLMGKPVSIVGLCAGIFFGFYFFFLMGSFARKLSPKGWYFETPQKAIVTSILIPALALIMYTIAITAIHYVSQNFQNLFMVIRSFEALVFSTAWGLLTVHICQLETSKDPKPKSQLPKPKFKKGKIKLAKKKPYESLRIPDEVTRGATQKEILVWMIRNGKPKPENTGEEDVQKLNETYFKLLENDSEFRELVDEYRNSWLKNSLSSRVSTPAGRIESQPLLSLPESEHELDQMVIAIIKTGGPRSSLGYILSRFPQENHFKVSGAVYRLKRTGFVVENKDPEAMAMTKNPIKLVGAQKQTLG